jgi:hypothetical protein
MVSGGLKAPGSRGALSKIFPEENFRTDHKPLGFPIQEGYGRKFFSIYEKWRRYKQRKVMEREKLIQIIQKRLGLSDEEFQVIKDTPKFQRLFDNALAASQYRLVAEVKESTGCHSGHVVGQKLVFDSSGNLLTRQSPERICAFLMPNLTMVLNARPQ